VIKKALIIPDTHRPFHHRKAYSIMMEAAYHTGVDEVVILGDYADFYSVSRHRKDPRVGTLIDEEIDSVRSGLDEIDACFPQAKKVFLEGNHEYRLESFLIDQAPAVFGSRHIVTEVKHLFGLHDRPNWTYVPFGRAQSYRILGAELFAFHRPKASVPRSHIAKVFVSSIYGDVHKIERAHAVGLDGRHLVSVCPGWLGDVASRVFDYMPGVPQWQLGFAIVSIEETSRDFFIDTFEIKNNRALVFGKEFRA